MSAVSLASEVVQSIIGRKPSAPGGKVAIVCPYRTLYSVVRTVGEARVRVRFYDTVNKGWSELWFDAERGVCA